MLTATKTRHWTEGELHGVVLEYALAGGNCFYCEDKPGPVYEFLKSSSLITTSGARPNQIFGGHPKEWDAGGREAWEGNQWVCPLIPEAGRLGDGSDQRHGDRNLGYFKLESPLRNIPGAIDLLEQAQSAKSEEDQKRTLQSVIDLTNRRTTTGRRG